MSDDVTSTSGVQAGEPDVEVDVSGWPRIGQRDLADGEVHREQSREEHQLRRQPHDGPDADEVGPLRCLNVGRSKRPRLQSPRA